MGGDKKILNKCLGHIFKTEDDSNATINCLMDALKEAKVGHQKLFQGRRKRREGKAMKNWEVVRVQASITQPHAQGLGCALYMC